MGNSSEKARAPKCRGCFDYDRFRNRCRVDKAIRVMNGVPQGSCPKDCNGNSPVEKEEERE